MQPTLAKSFTLTLFLLASCSTPAGPETEQCPTASDLAASSSAQTHWNHSKAVIGQEYPATGEGIEQALRDGRDWLVFDAKSIPLKRRIRPHELTDTRFLVFEGPPGPHMTNFTRESPDAGFEFADGAWQLTITGMTLYGNRDEFPDSKKPMLQAQALDRTVLENMACYEAAGPCMVLGDSTADPGWVSATMLKRVEAERNDGPGIVLIQAADTHLDQLIIQRNGDGTRTPGLFWIGRTSFSGGTLTRSRFEGAGRNGYWGAKFVNVEGVDIWQNYFWRSHITAKESRDVRAYHNRLIHSRIAGDVAGHCNIEGEE